MTLLQLKLYGVPLSQPVRAVIWTLLQKKQPFELITTIPGANLNTFVLGSRHPDYLKLTNGRINSVPVMTFIQKDKPEYSIGEAAAIMTHLCELLGYDDLYPQAPCEEKRDIDSFLHWHHSNSRQIAQCVFPIFKQNKPGIMLQNHEPAAKAMKSIEEGWLSSQRNFISGSKDQHSIADILLYEEIYGTHSMGLIPGLDEGEYPNIAAWMDRMKQQVPFHDEAHAAIISLGDCSTKKTNALLPLQLRLVWAIVSGKRAVLRAQSGF